MKKDHNELAEVAPRNIYLILDSVAKDIPQYYKKKYREEISAESIKRGYVIFSNNVLKILRLNETIQMLIHMNFIDIFDDKRMIIIKKDFMTLMNYRATPKIKDPIKVLMKSYKRFILDYRARYASYLEDYLQVHGIEGIKIICNRNASSIYIAGGDKDHLKEVARIVLNGAIMSNGTMYLTDKPKRHIVLKLKYSHMLDTMTKGYEPMITVNDVTSILNSLS